MAAKKKQQRVITRRGIKRPSDTGETLEDLERLVGPQGLLGVEGTKDIKRVVSRADIFVAEKVFQWRRPKHNMIPSDDHILGLARAVQDKRPLPPLLVFPVAQRLYVVDGHHRLAAYDTAGWKQAIPVHVLACTLDEAWRTALKNNIHDKLPMSADDKTNAAWIFVKKGDPKDSKARIMDLTGVSKGTVDNMRRVLSRLRDLGLGAPEDLAGLSWGMARMREAGMQDEQELEDWRERQADKIIASLQKAKLAGLLTKDPDITALVLAKLSDNLPAALMAEWQEPTERLFDPHEAPGDDVDF